MNTRDTLEAALHRADSLARSAAESEEEARKWRGLLGAVLRELRARGQFPEGVCLPSVQPETEVRASPLPDGSVRVSLAAD